METTQITSTLPHTRLTIVRLLSCWPQYSAGSHGNTPESSRPLQTYSIKLVICLFLICLQIFWYRCHPWPCLLSLPFSPCCTDISVKQCWYSTRMYPRPNIQIRSQLCKRSDLYNPLFLSLRFDITTSTGTSAHLPTGASEMAGHANHTSV